MCPKRLSATPRKNPADCRNDSGAVAPRPASRVWFKYAYIEGKGAPKTIVYDKIGKRPQLRGPLEYGGRGLWSEGITEATDYDYDPFIHQFCADTITATTVLASTKTSKDRRKA